MAAGQARFILQECGVDFFKRGSPLACDVPMHQAVQVYVREQGRRVGCPRCQNYVASEWSFLPDKSEITEDDFELRWIREFWVHPDPENIGVGDHSGWYCFFEKVPKITHVTSSGKTVRIVSGEGWVEDLDYYETHQL